MKKIIIAIAIIGILLGMNYYEHHYNKEVSVIAIHNQEVIVKDKQGCVWSFYGDGYEVGQELKATFFDNTTTQINDDEIIKIK